MPLAKNGLQFVLPMHQHCVLISLPLASSDLLSKSCNINWTLNKIKSMKLFKSAQQKAKGSGSGIIGPSGTQCHES